MSLLKAQGIIKRYPGVVALDDVTVEFQASSCHALMGENGAGKSTLGKILGGLISPDAGTVELDGKSMRFRGPREAVAAGISVVHQELLFAENLTVADNLSLGDLPAQAGFINEAALRQRAADYLSTIGSDIDPSTRVGDLPVSKQQLVQIAAGVGRGARVMIFDEPTSSLSQAESTRLLALIRELKAQGIACIYVSHRLEEIFQVCDTVTVLRDGKHVATKPVEGLTRDELVTLMVGRTVTEQSAAAPEPGPELLSVKNLSRPGRFSDISFSIRAGEIVGLAGLVGAGRTEVVEALFGLDTGVTGELLVHGKAVKIQGPHQMMAAGLGLVPEDRKRHGLVLGMNARENVSLPTLDRLARFGFVDRPKERALATGYFDSMRVKAPHIEVSTLGLSGGNQQKLVIAKWLAAEADVLFVDEPTRGVDVGAKAEIHDLLRALAKAGKAVFVVSSDLPELLSLATRLLVMREGRLVGELPANPGEQAVMRLMAGA